MDEVKLLIERAEHAKRGMQLMRTLYRDAMILGTPHREDWDETTPGEDKQRHVYDSTFQNSLERLTNALYTGMFAPWLTWFELEAGDDVDEEEKDTLKAQLEAPAEKLRKALLRSNFYSAIHPWLGDLIMGTGVMLIEEDEDTDVTFIPIPISKAALEEGRQGRIEGLFRTYSMTGRRFLRDFGKEAASAKLRRAIEKDANCKIDLISCIYYDKDNHERPWCQKVIYPADAYVVKENHFFSKPFVAPRWSVLTGEIYGRGPALKVAADAYSLNEAARLLLMQANMHLYGMYTTTDADMNPDTLELGPGVFIPVDSNDNSNPTLRALDVSGSMEIGDYVVNRLESSIQKGLYRDNLGQVEGPRMTATEIIERQSLVMQDMGAGFGRINAEGTDQILERVAEILSRRVDANGISKFPPVRVDGKIISIKYTSPLARAQEAEEVNAIRGLVADAMQMAQVDPSAAARIDSGIALTRIAANTGVPLEMVRDDAHVQEIMDKMAMAQQSAAAPE